MKYFRNSAFYLVLIYVAILGLAVVFGASHPLKVASFVYVFIPIDVNITEQPFILYRLLLWFTATIVFLILVIFIGCRGIPEANVEKIQLLRWWHVTLIVILSPIAWIFYPIISMCTTCITGNDIAYFILTVSFFIALQTLAQVVILKINIFFRRK